MVLDLIITTKCNLKCKYCFEEFNEYKSEIANEKNNYFDNDKDMSFENAKYIIDKVIEKPDDKLVQINFLGGEPLLKFELIKKIVNYCNERFASKDLRFSTTTNVTLFNEVILEFMINNNFYIKFSIDGCSKSHNKNRVNHNGEGSFYNIEKNLLNVKRFIDVLNNSAEIKYILSSNNIQYFYESMIYLSQFNIPISFELNHEEVWSQDGIDIFKSQLDEYLKKYKEFRVKGSTCNEIESILYAFSTKKSIDYCGACKNILTFLPNGDIYPCARFISIDKFKIGNIFNDVYIDKSISENFCKQTECNIKCSIKNSCNNQCKYINYLYTKDILKGSKFNCQIQKLINYSTYIHASRDYI